MNHTGKMDTKKLDAKNHLRICSWGGRALYPTMLRMTLKGGDETIRSIELEQSLWIWMVFVGKPASVF